MYFLNFLSDLSYIRFSMFQVWKFGKFFVFLVFLILFGYFDWRSYFKRPWIGWLNNIFFDYWNIKYGADIMSFIFANKLPIGVFTYWGRMILENKSFLPSPVGFNRWNNNCTLLSAISESYTIMCKTARSNSCYTINLGRIWTLYLLVIVGLFCKNLLIFQIITE